MSEKPKADAEFVGTAKPGERIEPEPKRNVHPLFGRILRAFCGERIDPQVDGTDIRD